MKIELIAECATSHGGDLALAKEFIWRFAEVGADWIKFQHTRVKHLRPDDPQYDWFTKAEFSVEQFAELKATCEQAGTKFLTTVYHAADVPEVISLGCEAIKVGSGEANEPDLAWAVNSERSIDRVFVSNGLANQWSLLRWMRASIFRCQSRYPHPVACAVASYTYPCIGYSDHAVGIEGCQLAIALGARIIEKHVQLPNQARPCQPWEATVQEFQALRAFADDDPVAKYVGRWQHG